MHFSKALYEKISGIINSVAGQGEIVRRVQPVAGGDINRSFRVEGSSASYFLKVNSVEFSGMFQKEAMGLKKLGTNTPEVMGEGVVGEEAFLLMEWIEPGNNTAKAQENLGQLLAEIHLQTAPEFGLEYDNYMGSLPQYNAKNTSWTAFFAERRLGRQLKMARVKGYIDPKLDKDFESLVDRLDSLYPKESAALLHGDLWGGNYLITSNDKPILIDPAIYFGHREMDIALSRLFGGFSSSFYTTYNECFPLEQGWEDRVSLWNLYPLLVHVNLFGRSYLPRLKECLYKWV